MVDFLFSGYPALFLLSFLASTLIPLGSEWLLVTLLLKGYNPVLTVAAATTGNTLGACTTYLIGLLGAPLVIERVLGISDEQKKKAQRLYNRYGSWSLLLSWLPVAGDPLCLAGGILRVGFLRFLLLVAAGKLARYVIVCLATLEAASR